MSQTLRTSLVIDGDARGGTRAIRDWRQAVLAMNADIERMERGTKSASASAEVFEATLKADRQAVDQLRAGLDPLYAQTRRLQAGTELLANAQRSGAITAKQQAQMLDLLETQHRQATAAITQQTQATRDLRFMTAGGAGGLQNFSFQLQDIFTQVGMGVPLMISLGQQAPQLLSGFGAVGAVLGVAAAAVFPLTAALFGLGYQSGQTGSQVKSASDLMVEAINAIGNAHSVLQENTISNLDAIQKKYGDVTRDVLGLMKVQNDLAVAEARRSVATGLQASIGQFDQTDIGQQIEARRIEIENAAEELRQAEADFAARSLTTDVLAFAQQAVDEAKARLTEALDLSEITEALKIEPAVFQQFDFLQSQIEDALDADNAAGLLDQIVEMRELLQQIPDGPLREMLPRIVEAEDALRQMEKAGADNAAIQAEIEAIMASSSSIDMSSNLAAGVAQASALADELGRAVSNAIALANQGVGAVRRAEINYQFRDDPIGRAGALAGAEFDSRVDLPSNAPTPVRNRIHQERQEFIQARIEAAQYTEQLQAWQAEQRAAASAARGGGGGGRRGGGGGGRSQLDQAARERQRTVDDIERQMDRLAPSYSRDLAALQEWRAEALSTLNPAAQGYEAFAQDVEFIFGERLRQAYVDDLNRRNDWRSGLERGLISINDDLISFADVTENIVTNWSEGLEDQFISFAKTGKASVSDLVDFTIEQMLRMAYQAALMPGINAGFGAIANAIVPGAGDVFTAGLTATQSHAGSQIGVGGVRRTYGGGAPLRNDEQLTVTKIGQRIFTPEQIANGSTVVNALAQAAQQGGGGPTNVTFAPTITIENKLGRDVRAEAREEPDGRGGRRYIVQLSEEVSRAIEQRGGAADRALKRRGAQTPGTLR